MWKMFTARSGPCGIASLCLLLCRRPLVGAQVISWWAFIPNSVTWPRMLEKLWWAFNHLSKCFKKGGNCRHCGRLLAAPPAYQTSKLSRICQWLCNVPPGVFKQPYISRNLLFNVHSFALTVFDHREWILTGTTLPTPVVAGDQCLTQGDWEVSSPSFHQVGGEKGERTWAGLGLAVSALSSAWRSPRGASSGNPTAVKGDALMIICI